MHTDTIFNHSFRVACILKHGHYTLYCFTSLFSFEAERNCCMFGYTLSLALLWEWVPFQQLLLLLVWTANTC